MGCVPFNTNGVNKIIHSPPLEGHGIILILSWMEIFDKQFRFRTANGKVQLQIYLRRMYLTARAFIRTERAS